MSKEVVKLAERGLHIFATLAKILQIKCELVVKFHRLRNICEIFLM